MQNRMTLPQPQPSLWGNVLPSALVAPPATSDDNIISQIFEKCVAQNSQPCNFGNCRAEKPSIHAGFRAHRAAKKHGENLIFRPKNAQNGKSVHAVFRPSIRDNPYATVR